MTLNRVCITQSSVIRIIRRIVGLKCFLHLLKFLLLSLVFAILLTFNIISQRSVKTHLLCNGIYNNRIIANCMQSVPVKEFLKIDQ